MNWKNIINDLISCGLTQVQIAAACNCTQSTISGLVVERRHQPTHALGEAILALHKKHARKIKALTEASNG